MTKRIQRERELHCLLFCPAYNPPHTHTHFPQKRKKREGGAEIFLVAKLQESTAFFIAWPVNKYKFAEPRP
jgi:hypothetical protein